MERDNNQTPRARVAWLTENGQTDEETKAALAKADYRLEDGAGAPVDIVVADLRTQAMNAKTAQRMAAQVRKASPECGVVFAAPSLINASERAHLRRFGDLVIAEDGVAPVIEACRNRLRLRAIADETGERLKSVASASRLGEFPPIRTTSEPPVVLVAGAPCPEALAAMSAAEDVAADAAAALSASQAMRALESGRYDCAVFLPRSKSDPLIALARTLRRHRRFQTTPVIMVAKDTGSSMSLSAANADEAIYAGHLSDDLGQRITAVARRGRLMGSMRTFLTACAGAGVRDGVSGVFTPAFFGQHGARIVARSTAQGRPASLLAVRILPGADGELCGRTLTDAARLINRVCRVEDCVGRLSRDTFVAVLNGAPADDAQAVAARVCGVLANTMFRTDDGRKLQAVAAAAAAIECTHGALLEEGIAAAIARLSDTAPVVAER